MVDVTIDNYEKILPDCVRHIQNSDFVAIGTCFLSFFFSSSQILQFNNEHKYAQISSLRVFRHVRCGKIHSMIQQRLGI